MEHWNNETMKKNEKMDIRVVWLKINDFPNIPSFQHSIIPKERRSPIVPTFHHSAF